MPRSILSAALWVALAAAPLLSSTHSPSQVVLVDGGAIKLTDPRMDVSQATTDPAGFAWNMFVYTNWPEVPGHRGAPDFGRYIGQPGATVWESFKNVSEIYQANGQRPVGWDTDDELPMALLNGVHFTRRQLDALGPVDSNWVHFLAEPIMIDGQQICDSDSNVIQYDVRGDYPYFDYVVNNPSGYELYNIEGQQAALNDPTFTFGFPPQTVEVKASWRILPAGQDTSRYWKAIGVYWDDKHVLHKARIGLTGLHITSRVVPDWVWMTFEQVENPTAAYKSFLGQKGASLGPNPNSDSNLAPINQRWQQKLAGTKWQYYKLIKVQTKFADSSNQPVLSGNTQMETYFQANSSCITCHRLASIGAPQKLNQELRLEFFRPLEIGR